MIVGIVAAAALGATYSVTRDPIAEANAQAELDACSVVLPGVAASDKVFSINEDGEMEFADSISKELMKSFSSAENTELREALSTVYHSEEKGYIFIVSSRGYKGAVTNAVGVDPAGRITKVSNVTNSETTNLGTKALNEEYLERNYSGKSLNDSTFQIGKDSKDIDGITGATVSSKAVARDSLLALQAYTLFSSFGSSR